MSVWRAPEAASVTGRTVVTIGNFDGVHRGHQAVLARAVESVPMAGVGGGGPARVVAVTFDPHPLAVLAPARAPAVLTPLDRRVELLLESGADDVLVLGFDSTMAAWSPEHFVRRVLVDTLQAGIVVVGTGFRFGSRAAGTVDTLRTEGARRGYDVAVVEPVTGTDDVTWSSTLVRAAVADGDVVAAARALGRAHEVEGVVVEGDHRGRELGYPTANVPAPAWLAVPSDGVYAGTLRRLDRQEAASWPAAVSVGTNPTFDGATRRVEAYVLDRDDLQLYDVAVRVSFHARLRGQVRFDDAPALVAQMADDVDRARTALAGP